MLLFRVNVELFGLLDSIALVSVSLCGQGDMRKRRLVHPNLESMPQLQLDCGPQRKPDMMREEPSKLWYENHAPKLECMTRTNSRSRNGAAEGPDIHLLRQQLGSYVFIRQEQEQACIPYRKVERCAWTTLNRQLLR